MTDREVWAQGMDDYKKAHAIAVSVLGGAEGPVVQAATATILIHVAKLRDHQSYLDAIAKRAPSPTTNVAQSAGAVATIGAEWPVGFDPEHPECPKCGGAMWDNRTNKKNPKSPDFACKDKTCLNDKGFGTGVWRDKKAKAHQPAPIDQVPPALAPQPKDDLPF